MKYFGLSFPGRGLQIEPLRRAAKAPEKKQKGRIKVPDEKVAEAKKLMQTHCLNTVSTITGLSVNYLTAVRDELIRANVKPAP